jgi:hypothetical protein
MALGRHLGQGDHPGVLGDHSPVGAGRALDEPVVVDQDDVVEQLVEGGAVLDLGGLGAVLGDVDPRLGAGEDVLDVLGLGVAVDGGGGPAGAADARGR